MLWLAGTVMREVAARSITRSQQYCGWLARLSARSGHVTFHGASNIVVGWLGYGRGQARNISRSLQYCSWLARLSARSGPVMFYGASNYVVGWHGYGRCRVP